jgi:hypothetical protein
MRQLLWDMLSHSSSPIISALPHANDLISKQYRDLQRTVQISTTVITQFCAWVVSPVKSPAFGIPPEQRNFIWEPEGISGKKQGRNPRDFLAVYILAFVMDTLWLMLGPTNTTLSCIQQKYAFIPNTFSNQKGEVGRCDFSLRHSQTSRA